MISHPIIDDVNLDHLIKSLADFSTVKSLFFHSNLQYFHLFMYRNMDLTDFCIYSVDGNLIPPYFTLMLSSSPIRPGVESSS